jgi:hypothetical protein
MAKQCPVEFCKGVIPPNQMMCGNCFRMVPEDVRRELKASKKHDRQVLDKAINLVNSYNKL